MKLILSEKEADSMNRMSEDEVDKRRNPSAFGEQWSAADEDSGEDGGGSDSGIIDRVRGACTTGASRL